ncbi:citrate (Si)-synthase [Bacteriovorax sp. BSW11_IV]|uniref:citrate synthase n=1 Tax=Bacteriovorax sp. BSW11_IV TaxID=1353529 RepID=UPI000389EA63|nr:citrate synthase [Bacteriovorax sp. BSW11_IV]EQC49192.1 citrate (Si)-synthase [Bacteriovorax sp. BSW11_IV]
MSNAKFELDGKVFEFPVIEGTEGEKAVDITKLRGETGYVTIDSGYGNTGSCTSAITFLDGEKGILHYRGYPIEQLAEKSNFTEVSYLLLNGKLPTEAELKAFDKAIADNSELPAGVKTILDAFPKDAHPMGVLSSVVSALTAFYPELLGAELSKSEQDKSIAQLMGQVKVAMTYFFSKSVGKAPKATNAALSYSEDFLSMMFNSNDAIDPEVVNALDILLVLHADHEQNCSTSTVRMVGSSHANIFATIAAGIDALWGPLHGGANQAVLEMLEEIQNDGGDYKKFLEKAKDKNDSFRLMGFGHRVYKNFDPRAKIIKKACDTVLTKLNVNDPLLKIAKGLEEEALKDPYFVERKLYPNVDFYSGIIYKALGIPTNMFTAMFVLGRLPGWLAQWKELRESGARISRPRQIYTGETARDYVEMNKR